MVANLILASGSTIRASLLSNAGVPHVVSVARIDEETVKISMQADGISARDIADALAEMKARKVSDRNPEAMVLGCDQVLDFQGAMLSKPKDPQDALEQLHKMNGQRHMLHSAAVIYDRGEPVWRHVGTVRLQMRTCSDSYLRCYVDRNWTSIRDAVGGYKLEEEGVRLFSRIEGDYFNVLGLPLLEILAYLSLRGVIEQ